MKPNLAMFSQMAGGQGPQGGGQPPMPAPGPQMPPGGMPPQGGGAPPQPGQPPTPAGGPQHPQNPLMAVANPALKQAAQQGEGADDTLAHVTKGEVMVPPQVQTPKVLAELRKAFAKAGANPAQYVVGSPQMQMNSQTGAPQFGFSFADILPFIGTAAGSFFGGPWGGAAGGALGGAIAGTQHGGGSGSVLGGAALGGLGGYFGGSALADSFPETFGAGAGMGTGAAGAGAGGMGAGIGAPAGMDPTAAANFAAENTANPAGAALTQNATGQMAASQGANAAKSGYLSQFSNWIQQHPAMALGGGAAALYGLNAMSNNQGYATPNAPLDPSFNKQMTPQSQLPAVSSLVGGGSQNTRFPNGQNAYQNYGYGPGYNFFTA